MTATSFPADHLDACFRNRILTLFKATQQEDEVTRLAIRFCHWVADGEHAPWAGFRAVVSELRAALAADESPRPTLILGFHTPDRVRGRPEAAVLAWPGATYVRYDASDDELRAAVGQAIQGAREPLPARLLPDAAEILSLTFEVRHWLQNRRDNAEGAITDFAAAACGENWLHESYLNPVEAISRQHRQSLDRLWELEAAVAHLAPRIGGLRAVRTAIDEFEVRWEDLEQARRRLRGCVDHKRAGALADVRDRYIGVRQALLAAIAAIDDLDAALKQRQE